MQMSFKHICVLVLLNRARTLLQTLRAYSCFLPVVLPGTCLTPEAPLRELFGSSEWEPENKKAAPTSAAAEEVLWQYLVGNILLNKVFIFLWFYCCPDTDRLENERRNYILLLKRDSVCGSLNPAHSLTPHWKHD